LRQHLTIASLIAVTSLAAAASAQEGDARPRVRVAWSDQVPVVDGLLDDAVWREAALVDHFVQVTPEEGAAPSERTELRIVTDGNVLYMAVRCYDHEVSELIANRMMRDNRLFYQDSVSFIFDTFRDGRNGYYFEINARGSRRDVLVEGNAFEGSWDAVWEARSRIDAEGWTTEIAIPFQSLSFDPESDSWGFNFSRSIRGPEEEVRWADPVAHRYIADLGQAGVLEGLRGIHQGLGLEIVPTFAVRRVDDREEDRHYTRLEPSGDLFYKILPSLTATITVNTDFGETEVDAREINLTRFALFYPEKRDFFLQDALIFDFAHLEGNGEPFFSRRIGLTPDGEPFPLVAGAKITGRITDRYKLGVLNVQADSYDDVSQQNLTVARGAVNLSEASTLGAMVTHGNPEGGPDNTLAGVDFLYKRSDFLGDLSIGGGAWVQKSFTEGVHGQDVAYGGNIEYPNDTVNWAFNFMQLGKNFAPAMGFVNRPDIREYGGHWRYRIRRTGLLRTFDSQIGGTLVTDTDDVLDSIELRVSPMRVATYRQDILEPIYRHYYERLDEPFEIHPGVTIPPGKYHYDEGGIRIESGRSRDLRVRLLVGGGSFYDGWRFTLIPLVTWRPSQHWLFEASYQYNDIALGAGSFHTHLARLQVSIQFTADISWTTLAQWDNQSNDLGINSRLRWIIEDGRELFLVFNQDLDTEDGVRVLRTEPILKLFWSFRF